MDHIDNIICYRYVVKDVFTNQYLMRSSIKPRYAKFGDTPRLFGNVANAESALKAWLSHRKRTHEIDEYDIVKVKVCHL